MKKRRRANAESKRPVPELLVWQRRALEIVTRSPLASTSTFAGGAALSAVFLHHRRTEDLDFFLSRPLQPADLGVIKRGLAKDGTRIEEQVIGSLTSLVLLKHGDSFGKIDFSFHPVPLLDEGVAWNGLTVESLLDMTVNRLGALLNRHQGRDYVDLYFLLQEGPERNLKPLIGQLEQKLDVAIDALTLANRFIDVRSVSPSGLPRMLRRFDFDRMREFFWNRARELVRLR